MDEDGNVEVLEVTSPKSARGGFAYFAPRARIVRAGTASPRIHSLRVIQMEAERAIVGLIEQQPQVEEVHYADQPGSGSRFRLSRGS